MWLHHSLVAAHRKELFARHARKLGFNLQALHVSNPVSTEYFHGQGSSSNAVYEQVAKDHRRTGRNRFFRLWGVLVSALVRQRDTRWHTHVACHYHYRHRQGGRDNPVAARASKHVHLWPAHSVGP